jgi:Tol biopolymer transport system component
MRGASVKRIHLGAALVACGSIVAVAALATDENRAGIARTRVTAGHTGAWNIFVTDLEKRKMLQLTHNEEEEFTLDPAWAPGAKIAFSQADCEGCPSKLAVISPRGGGGATRVRSRLGGFVDPAWAPGGNELAVARGSFGLYVIELRNGAARRLTRGRTDARPTWRPDAERIAFERQVSATNWDVYLVASGGGKPRPLVHTSAQETSPAWSPDGRRVAFARQEANGNWTIHTVRADGSGDRRITSRRSSSQAPAWSPSGSRIAYVDQAGGGGTVMVVSARGGRPRRVTEQSMQANRPAWSPDGTRIAFAARR